MGSLRRSIDSRSLSDRDISQAQFREQIGYVTDLLRQVAGDARICAGNKQSAVSIASPFQLYVDPLIGSDAYTSGYFNDYISTGNDKDVFVSTVSRLSNQKLLCGYSAHRPFKTINRAVLEAAILLASFGFDLDSWQAQRIRVVIHLAAGVHELLNTPGSASAAAQPRPWADGSTPTREQLIWFNATVGGGVILPRGVTIQGAGRDLTIIQPLHVPAGNPEGDGSKRGAVFAITGQSVVSGITWADCPDYLASHHALDPIQVVRAEDLNRFYEGVLQVAVDRPVVPELCRPAPDELHFGPAPTDTTGCNLDAAQPWASIRHCGIRSAYGMAGIHVDGRRMGGLQRLEVRDLAGSSNQRDMTVWQLLNPLTGEAENVDVVRFSNASATALEPKAGCGHAALRATHGARIQAFGVELEGFSYGGLTQDGGCLEVDGVLRHGVWGLKAEGYRTHAHPQDRGWHLQGVRAPEVLHEGNSSITWIQVGRVARIEGHGVQLQEPLRHDTKQPLLQGYSLRSGSLLWIEGDSGERWSLPIAADPWSRDEADWIKVDGELASSRPRELALELVGAKVMIRRLVDRRPSEQRACAVLLSNTQYGRLPERGDVLRLDEATPGLPLLEQPASTLKVQWSQAVDELAVGQLRGAAVVLQDGERAVAPVKLLDDDTDADPLSTSCGWPLDGTGWMLEGSDADAVWTLLAAVGGCSKEQVMELLRPGRWWERDRGEGVVNTSTVLAIHEGSRITAKGIELRDVGYGNRSKGEHCKQIGVASDQRKKRLVVESEGGIVVM